MADFKSKLAVATGVIQSKIQYLLPLYGGAPDYLLRAVKVQQLKAARFVCGYSSYFWSTPQDLWPVLSETARVSLHHTVGPQDSHIQPSKKPPRSHVAALQYLHEGRSSGPDSLR